jgi:cobalt-zinc-cadmium efflux system protein
MSHDHASHGHLHAHEHPAVDSLNRAFLIGIALNIIFVIIEFGAGFWLDSLALLSDAGHNLSDVVSLALALLAYKLARMKPTTSYTYGYKKSTILVSLVNACILLVAVGGIIIESIHKLERPVEVAGGMIAWVAGVGIVINALTALLFMKGRKHDLNIQGAFLHMMADALVSVGVLIAGIIISRTGWYIIDPIIGVVVAVVIFLSTWNLLHDSVRLTLDGVPRGIDSQAVVNVINETPGVESVHHVHIWAISTTENALTAHIVLKEDAEAEEVKHDIRSRLVNLNISHATLELEAENEHCEVNEED